MAGHRRPLARTPDLTFAKLLGTGDGSTFTARDADPRTWGLLAVWAGPAAAAAFEESPVARSWRRIADEQYRLDLRPLASSGRWSAREPFGDPDRPSRWTGPVAAITRARLVPSRAVTFWRAVPPVVADLHARPGLLAAVGIGEAPIGLQGTLSVWRSAADLNTFAYNSPAHAEAVRRTMEVGWYAEELFARFAVLGSTGTLRGRDPLAEEVTP
jgi:hypothetical protein